MFPSDTRPRLRRHLYVNATLPLCTHSSRIRRRMSRQSVSQETRLHALQPCLTEFRGARADARLDSSSQPVDTSEGRLDMTPGGSQQVTASIHPPSPIPHQARPLYSNINTSLTTLGKLRGDSSQTPPRITGTTAKPLEKLTLFLASRLDRSSLAKSRPSRLFASGHQQTPADSPPEKACRRFPASGT